MKDFLEVLLMIIAGVFITLLPFLILLAGVFVLFGFIFFVGYAYFWIFSKILLLF